MIWIWSRQLCAVFLVVAVAQVLAEIQLSRVSPMWLEAGAFSTKLTLTGIGFSLTQSYNLSISALPDVDTILIDDVPLLVESSNEMTGFVNQEAVALVAGYVVLTVSDIEGSGESFQGLVSVYDRPTVLDVSPDRVAFFGGSALVINGTDFVPSSDVSVRFRHIESGYEVFAPGTVVDDKSITCTSPAFDSEDEEVVTEVAVALDGQNYVAAGSTLTFYDKGVLRVGFIFSSPINDFGWTFQQNFGRMSLEVEYGTQMETYYVENVPENDPVFLDHVDQLVKPVEEGGHGCTLIFSGSFAFLAYTRTAAAAHPEANFVHLTGYVGPDDTDNIAYGWNMIYEMRYLAGMVAGLHVETCVGYIAAYDNVPEVRRGINAFAKGCREVNPDCTVKVHWISAWHDAWIEESAAKVMLELGCDIITQHSDSEEPQKVFSEAGKLGIGYNSDMRQLVGDSVLTGPMLVWFPLFDHFTQAVMTDSWRPREEYFGYSFDGGVTLAPYSPTVTYETRALVLAKWEELLRAGGSEVVFCGDMVTNTGAAPPAEQLGEDGCLTLTTLTGMDAGSGYTRPLMDWHYAGVEDLGYYTAPPDESMHCGEKDYSYNVSGCVSSRAARVAQFYWLTPKTCEGGQQLPVEVEIECDEVPLDSVLGRAVIGGCVLGALVGVVCGVLVFVHRTKPIFRAAQVPFMLLFVVGAILFAITPIGLLGENSDGRCVAEVWLFHVAFTTMFAPLFIKIWRVWRVLDNPTLKRRNINNQQLFQHFLVLLCVDILLLTLWTVTDPPSMKLEEEVEPGVGPVQHRRCDYGSGPLTAISFLFQCGLVCGGVYLSWVTRHLDFKFSEAKYLVIAIYNIMLIGLLTLLITQATGASVSSRVMMESIALIWGAVFSLVLMVGPKYVIRHTVTADDLVADAQKRSNNSRSATPRHHTSNPMRLSDGLRSSNVEGGDDLSDGQL